MRATGCKKKIFLGVVATLLLLATGMTTTPVQAAFATDIAVGPVVSYPQFDATINDYAMNCDAGSNDVTFTVSAPAGSTIVVAGTPVASGVPLVVSLLENDLVEVLVDDAATTESYWYRCLPADFPTYQVDRPGDPTPGYYAVGFGLCQCPEDANFVALLNTHGVPVWYKRTLIAPRDIGALDDGTLYWAHPNIYELHDLDGSLVQSLNADGYEIDGHELLKLANGNWLVMSYVERQGVDLTSIGLGQNQTVIDGYLQELLPDGTAVWEWRSQDHIAVEESIPMPSQNIRDLVHLNSAEELPNGDIMISARRTGVYRIDRTTGAIVWKLGGTATPESLTLVGDTLGGPLAQHDARMLPDGTIGLYDNRSGTVGEGSRAVQYEIDAVAGTATLVREHRRADLAASPFIGSTRFAADGSVVVGWGALQPRMEELDVSGNLLLSFSGMADLWYRAVKYPLSHWDIADLRAGAGGLAENDAPVDPIATSTGSGEVTVSWDPPVVGQPISSYTVTATPGGLTCTSTTTSCLFTGLDTGEFSFVVVAQNQWGVGGPTRSIPITLCGGLGVTVDLAAGQLPSPGDDVIWGTPGADVISAGDGDDTVCARDGDDVVNGGPGDDTVFGLAGDDTLYGSGGSDYLDGGLGVDTILGMDGADDIEGGDGADVLNGGPGNDTIDGGNGPDQIFGQDGDDTVLAGDGDDLVIGFIGVDDIDGGLGNDVLNGGDGNDTIAGGGGDDIIYGLAGDDSLVGGAGVDKIFGQLGVDIIEGGGGHDMLWGNAGEDDLTGGDGDDVLNGGPDADVLDGSDGNDSVYGGPTDNGDDTLIGGPGDDLLVAFGGDDTIDAGAGADVLNGGPGTDDCDGGPDVDTDTAYNCETATNVP